MSRKTRALLAYLALPAGRAHSREALAGLLWADTGDSQARNNLRHALVELRRALARVRAPVLIIDRGTVALDPAGVDVDVGAFERHAAGGTPAALTSAMSLYRGDLLEGLAVREARFDDWLGAERERLRELARGVLGRLVANPASAEAADVSAAVQMAGKLLALDPLQEDVHRALMRLHIREGRRGAALRQYQVCVDVLRRELNVDPDPETKTLYRELVQQPATASSPSARAEAPSAGTRTARPLPPDETPLIGRADEARRLGEALDEACRGRGRVATIVGEAGIGKSRLMHALIADAEARGARVIEGHSYESEQVLAFGPWVDALRAVDPARDAAILSRLDPVWRMELGRLLPELGEPGAAPTPAAPEPRRLFEAVERLVIALAVDAPLVLCLEDVHWADETSLRLLAFVARRIRTARVMIVATARDEELTGGTVLERIFTELGSERHSLRLNVGRLSDADTTALVQTVARAPGSADTARRLGHRIFALSEGNPFIAVEIARAWQEAAPSETSRGLALPERVRQVIAGRLSRLGARARELAAVAAVIGREFDFALAAQASGLTEAAAAEGVEELVRRRVLHGVDERLAFTHDRIRDVAYLDLLPTRRRLLHGQIAAALETRHAVDPAHYTTLARHHWESENWERAALYFRRAAEQAASRAAHREAAANLEQALEALARLPTSRARLEQAIDMRLRLGDHLFILGELDRIGAHVDLARPEVEALEDPRRLERVLALAGTHLRLTGRYRESIETSERARALAAAAAASPGVAADHNIRQASAYYSMGEYHRVIELGRQALDMLPGDLIYEHFGFGHSPAAFALYFRAIGLAELGEFSAAVEQANESLRVAERVGLPLSLLAAHSGAGFVRLRMGALAEAVTVLERGLRLYDPAEISFWAPILASSLGAAYALLGRADEAEVLLERAIEQGRAAGIVANQSIRIVWLGEACLAGKRPGVAAGHATRALDLARAHHERGHEAHALRLRGDVAAERGARARGEAISRYQEAMALGTTLGMLPLVASCHLALGRLHARAGDLDQARASAGIAAEMYRKMGMEFWTRQADALTGAPASPPGMRDAGSRRR